ncbi:hypothetical protein MB02_02275 [Croceicoccus estronivorus]|uniref:sugar phosphate isomerase/epimerase family protein n=1 Tax=Croceicoccus estronivorus TaxID=1172626 RepID=UPI00082DC846|nr:sugar phosphate isomerase/epimerase family protein [Croceicoccus estronivorus]OCC25485.1 hypothetical protein MB02_02275 [Croceicoccus estronivorus]
MAKPINCRLRLAGHLGLRSPDGPLFAHSARSRAPLDQLDYLAETGFAGAFDVFLKLRSAEEQTELGARMADLGLSAGTFNNDLAHWDQPLWSRDDAEAKELIRASIESSTAAAGRVGGGMAVCVTGIDSDCPRETQIETMIANLRAVATLAGDAGLMLMIEPVAPQWIPGLLVDNLADGAAIVRAVDSPAVRLLFDVGHLAMMGEEIVPAMVAHWDIIGGIQVADVPGRVEPGAGELDWEPIFSAIADHGYTGLVEIELLTAEDSAAGEENLVANLRAIDKALEEKYA